MKSISIILVAAIAATLPAHAATQTVGDTPAVACAKSAMAEQPDAAVSAPSRRMALAHCNTALAGKLLPADHAATLVNRGIIQAAAGNAEAALADYNEALARAPGLASAYLSRGATLMQVGRFQEARSDFDRALALNIDRPAIALFNRGMANEKLGALPAAYRDYKQAQALAPDFRPAALELARFQVTPQHVARNR
jgi:tetratricopeptide (TPR) repeat protein